MKYSWAKKSAAAVSLLVASAMSAQVLTPQQQAERAAQQQAAQRVAQQAAQRAAQQAAQRAAQQAAQRAAQQAAQRAAQQAAQRAAQQRAEQQQQRAEQREVKPTEKAERATAPVVRHETAASVAAVGGGATHRAMMARQVYGRYYTPSVVAHVSYAPPAGLSVEEQRARFVIVSPGPAYVFVPGYFWWTGGSYVWIAPAWAMPPQPGAIWVAPAWVQDDDGNWMLSDGYWQDGGG